MKYLAILLWNAVALLPVCFGNWSLFALVALFWFENVVIGLVQWWKIRGVERALERPPVLSDSRFFALHYGAFTIAHGVFLGVVFGLAFPGALAGSESGWWWAALSVAALHAWEAYTARGATQAVDTMRLSMAPYGRVVVLHLVILGGAGLLVMQDAQPGTALAGLVLLKVAVELLLARLGF